MTGLYRMPPDLAGFTSALRSTASATDGAGRVGFNRARAYAADTAGGELATLWVSPESQGAIGNGVAVDTAALQAAINTGQSVRGTPGRTYLVGPLTATTPGQCFDFRGCTLKRINASAHAAMLTLQGARQAVLGGRWDGSSAGQSGSAGDRYGHAAIAIAADYCRVDAAEVVDSWGIGVRGGACAYCVVDACRFIDAQLFAVYFETLAANKDGNEITDNFVSSVGLPGAGGIYLTGSNDYLWDQLHWEVSGNTCFGSQSAPTGIGITTRAIRGVIRGNITRGYTMGISADSAERTVISGNRCSDTAGASGYGIELNSGYNAVTGNVLTGCTYGLCISGTASAQDYNNVTGNTFEGCTRSIFVQAGSNPARWLNISGNLFVHAVAGQVGIYLQGNCERAHISGNQFAGPGLAAAGSRAVYLNGVSKVSIIGNRMSGWERAVALYAGSALAITDVTVSHNDVTQDMPGAEQLVSVEGSATVGARVVVAWNAANDGMAWCALDLQAKRIMQWSSTYATPLNNVPAGIGSLFINLNGGAGTLSVKQSASDATGWVAK